MDWQQIPKWYNSPSSIDALLYVVGWLKKKEGREMQSEKWKVKNTEPCWGVVYGGWLGEEGIVCSVWCMVGGWLIKRE